MEDFEQARTRSVRLAVDKVITNMIAKEYLTAPDTLKQYIEATFPDNLGSVLTASPANPAPTLSFSPTASPMVSPVTLRTVNPITTASSQAAASPIADAPILADASVAAAVAEIPEKPAKSPAGICMPTIPPVTPVFPSMSDAARSAAAGVDADTKPSDADIRLARSRPTSTVRNEQVFYLPGPAPLDPAIGFKAAVHLGFFSTLDKIKLVKDVPFNTNLAWIRDGCVVYVISTGSKKNQFNIYKALRYENDNEDAPFYHAESVSRFVCDSSKLVLAPYPPFTDRPLTPVRFDVLNSSVHYMASFAGISFNPNYLIPSFTTPPPARVIADPVRMKDFNVVCPVRPRGKPTPACPITNFFSGIGNEWVSLFFIVVAYVVVMMLVSKIIVHFANKRRVRARDDALDRIERLELSRNLYGEKSKKNIVIRSVGPAKEYIVD